MNRSIDAAVGITPPLPHHAVLALDLGTTTGWALSLPISNDICHGSISFKPNRFEGGGMRFLRFSQWLSEVRQAVASQSPQNAFGAVYFEEVRRHLGVDAAHAYGGFLATLTGWCEREGIAYQGVPVGTIKRHATGKGNASKDQVIGAMRAKGHQVCDDNEADALALLHCVLSHGGHHHG
jgi:Holliday junction resolvasome RuvABC endonuclease subunit